MAKKAAKRRTNGKPATRTVTPPKTSFLPGRLQGKSILLFGVPGVGKTSFAAAFPNPVFITGNKDTGIIDLCQYGQVDLPVDVLQCNNWLAVQRAIDSIGDREDCSTLILDSLTDMQELCFSHTCFEEYQGNWDQFYDFYKGPRVAAPKHWSDFIDTLNQVRAESKDVVLVAHSKTEDYENPDGPNYKRFRPRLDKEILDLTHIFCESVFFASYDIKVEKQNKGGNKAQGRGRELCVNWSPAYDAKNRYGIEEPIDMGTSGTEAYQNFQQALAEARKS